jgi:hypothetical protein
MTKGTQSRDVLIQMAVARQIRSQRAAFKRALREGRLDPVSVFIDPPPPVQGARLAEVLKSIPGIGPQKCERLTRRAGAGLDDRIEQLTDASRQSLADSVSALRHHQQS